MSRQRGQSLVEFAVGLAALSLLSIGTLTIAGFQEAQRRLIASARHAAFDAMWRNGRAAATPAARRLFESHFEIPGYVRPVPESPWIGPEDVRTGATSGSAPGEAATAAAALLMPLRVTGGFLGSAFDLSAGGFIATDSNVRMSASARLPEPFTAMDLAVSQPMALLSDAWNASGSGHVERRAAGLVPTSALRGLSSFWQALAAPLAIVEPGLDRLCLGLIDTESVPEDRLALSGSVRTGGERCP